MAALGEPVPPESRKGLVLFLRRGMWGWVRALASGISHQQPAHPSSTNPTAPGQQEPVVRTLAAMVLATNNGRAE